MTARSIKTEFKGHSGQTLAARVDLPIGPARAFALFAHCFTCSKDLFAARSIAQGLAERGIGVLRFDFTGLGASDGEFANTDFTSNIRDLVCAAGHMRDVYDAPSVLIGHSLGGAAVLTAAREISEVKAVATIGAPADVGHVLENFGSSLEEIREQGTADVTLAGRTFTIGQQFVEDAEGRRLADCIQNLRAGLLVLHSPVDNTVGIDNATKIFIAARHPKSFVSLDNADHLLSRKSDAAYAAGVIAAWAERFLPEAKAEAPVHEGVVVTETGQGKFQAHVVAGRHRLVADEPTSVGGLDTGPTPYDFLSAALGACTSMTLRMYASHKKLSLGTVSVEVRHGKVPADHCADCGEAAEGRAGKIDRFERVIAVDGDVDAELTDKIIEIAGKCPVHRTLEASSAVVTRMRTDDDTTLS